MSPTATPISAGPDRASWTRWKSWPRSSIPSFSQATTPTAECFVRALRTGERAMPEKEQVVLSWSGGKDSALALYELRRSARYEVVALLTTVAGEFDRVSHHGVRVELLEQQAAAVGVALHNLYLQSGRCTNEE